jgi:hypothetical protein
LPHNPHTQWFEDTLYRLEGFATLVEDMLAQEIAKLDVHLDSQAKALTETDRAQYFDWHAQDFFELATQLPSIHRYSIVTAADSALETYLTETCNTYADLERAPLRLQDLAGKGLPRTQQYLKKVAQVEFPDTLPAWASVLRLRDLRNSIVHADGQIAENRAALLGWIKSEKGIAVSRDGTVTLYSTFTTTALNWYRTFTAAFDVATQPLGLWGTVFPLEKPGDSERPRHR